MEMASAFDELITLTPMTCVRQCNALLDASEVKPRSYYLLAALFGIYCGAVFYRSYRQSKLNIMERLPIVQMANPEVGQVIVISSHDTVNSDELLLQEYRLEAKNGPILRWRYCKQFCKDCKPKKSNVMKDPFDAIKEIDQETFTNQFVENESELSENEAAGPSHIIK